MIELTVEQITFSAGVIALIGFIFGYAAGFISRWATKA